MSMTFDRHSADLLANLVLVGLINWKRAWRYLPVLCAVQILYLVLFVFLLAAYFIPAVPDSVYHPLTVLVDVLCTPLEILYTYELLLLGKREPLYFLGWASLGHAVVNMEEFVQGRYLPVEMIHNTRFEVNLFLTILLIPCVYFYTRREHYAA